MVKCFPISNCTLKYSSLRSLIPSPPLKGIEKTLIETNHCNWEHFREHYEIQLLRTWIFMLLAGELSWEMSQNQLMLDLTHPEYLYQGLDELLEYSEYATALPLSIF